MSGILSKDENAYLSTLKKTNLLKKFTREDMKNITKNGGIAIFCGDGDISIPSYHENIISERAHCVRLFGGPLLLCPSFRGFNKARADFILENIAWGKQAKETNTFFVYFHFPCGVATHFKHNMDDILNMAPEANDAINTVFTPKKILTFFHVKRINKGGTLEQNSYILL